MIQQEFNKQERFDKLIEETLSKDLGYRFILDSFKKNKWNLNMSQAITIANRLNYPVNRILYYALDLNILNVTTKEKKIIIKNRKNESL